MGYISHPTGLVIVMPFLDFLGHSAARVMDHVIPLLKVLWDLPAHLEYNPVSLTHPQGRGAQAVGPSPFTYSAQLTGLQWDVSVLFEGRRAHSCRGASGLCILSAWIPLLPFVV